MRTAAAERDVWVDPAADVEGHRVLEDLFVAVPGRVPHDDLLAGLHLLAAHLEVFRRSAAEVVHRRDVPKHLLDHRFEELRVAFQPLGLVGVLAQRAHPACDEVPGGLVAGDHQHDEEDRYFEVTEPVTVDLGVRDRGYQVFAGLVSPEFSEQVGIVVHLDERVLCRLHPGRVLGVIPRPDQRVAPAEDLVTILGRNAGELADDDQRQLCGDVGDEVALAFRPDRIEYLGDDLTDLVFECRDHPWMEPFADEVAQPRMPGRVHVDQHQLRAVDRIGDVHAFGGREAVEVLRGLDDVFVLRQAPVAGTVGLRLEVDRIVLAEPLELLVWDALLPDVEVVQVDVHGVSSSSPRLEQVPVSLSRTRSYFPGKAGVTILSHCPRD